MRLRFVGALSVAVALSLSQIPAAAQAGRGGAQDGSTAKEASGSSGSALQSCTGNGDHGWSSARDTLTSCQSKGGTTPLEPPAPRQ